MAPSMTAVVVGGGGASREAAAAPLTATSAFLQRRVGDLNTLKVGFEIVISYVYINAL